MEIELNIKRNERAYWIAALVAGAILVAVVFGWMGSGNTPVDASGNPQILSWQAWQLIQAEQVHSSELAALQADATQLASLLQNKPDPVAAQFIMDAVGRDVKNGTDPSLAAARQAMQTAAANVRDWASGALDQNSAADSVNQAMGLLR